MKDALTSLLEVIGLLAIAAGTVAVFLPLIGWAALILGGVVLIGGSFLAQLPQSRTKTEQKE